MTIAAIDKEVAREQEEKEMIRRTASSGGGSGLPNPPDQLSSNSFNQGGSGDAHHDMGGMASQIKTSRHISSTNIFGALEGKAGSRRGSVDAEKPVERKSPQLIPHSTPPPENENEGIESKSSDADSAAPRKTGDEARRSIEKTLNEYLSFKDLNDCYIKFDSICEKVIDIANLSVEENDGATLKLCTRIIFEKATDEPNFGAVCAWLCDSLMEEISPDIKDVNVGGATGGKLFRQYLVVRCKEDFKRGRKDRASTIGISLGDKDNGPHLTSDEYDVLMKAKRQGLGLIHFIGELFKLQILTERITHDCMKKLLANSKDPYEIEGLCELMTTVGLQLDQPEAKNSMDIYFTRMTEMTKSQQLPSRIRLLVQNVIDLRRNKWVNIHAAPDFKTITAIHGEAARRQEEKETIHRAASSGRPDMCGVASQIKTSRHVSANNNFAEFEVGTGDHRGSIDAEKPVERNRLQLLPRSTRPIENDNAGGEKESMSSDADSATPRKTKDEARRSIENTLMEYLLLKDMNELVTSVKELDSCYRPLFVTEFVNQSMEMKQSDVDSIAEIFKKLSSEKVLSEEEFEAGFADPLEFLPDTAIDVPNAYKYATLLLEAAGMDPTKAAKA